MAVVLLGSTDSLSVYQSLSPSPLLSPQQSPPPLPSPFPCDNKKERKVDQSPASVRNQGEEYMNCKLASIPRYVFMARCFSKEICTFLAFLQACGKCVCVCCMKKRNLYEHISYSPIYIYMYICTMLRGK
jgi:hypothetical protein